MADIAWSAYALAMFTPEQRNAAIAAVPNDPPVVLLPPKPPTSIGLPIRITGPGIGPEGLDPNNPAQLAMLHDLGWRFENGKWWAPSGGQATSPTAVQAANGGRPAGSLSSVAPLSAIAGGSVLGYEVPSAPPVLLPQWVGGRIGTVVRSGGTRPESGGVMLVKRGQDVQWARVRR